MSLTQEVEKQQLQEIAAYWNGRADGFDAEHDTEDLGLWKQQLKRLLGRPEEGPVLDVGTGTGFLGILLAESGYDVAGIDISSEMLAIAQRKAAAKNLQIDFVQGACEQLPFADETFTAVVNCRVMWTLTDPDAAVREWLRALKPGGRLVTFMRMMDIDTDAIYPSGGQQIELPLKRARQAEYLAVYRRVGLTEIAAEELPRELSRAEDMPGWTVFYGIKRGTRYGGI